MREKRIKHGILLLLGISFYMLFVLLLVTVKPSDGVVFLLMLLFAFLLVGVEFFFTIGTKERPAPINRREFFFYAMFYPFWVYMLLSAVDLLGHRRELALTALALFVAALYRAFLGAVDRAIMNRRK